MTIYFSATRESYTFASALQSCDELQYNDAVTRCFIAEAGTSTASHLNPMSSPTTGNLSRNKSFSIVTLTSVSSYASLSSTCFLVYILQGKHVLPTEMSSSIIAKTSSMALLQVYRWHVCVPGVLYYHY